VLTVRVSTKEGSRLLKLAGETFPNPANLQNVKRVRQLELPDGRKGLEVIVAPLPKGVAVPQDDTRAHSAESAAIGARAPDGGQPHGGSAADGFVDGCKLHGHVRASPPMRMLSCNIGHAFQVASGCAARPVQAAVLVASSAPGCCARSSSCDTKNIPVWFTACGQLTHALHAARCFLDEA
jgi:hypothetical protein